MNYAGYLIKPSVRQNRRGNQMILSHKGMRELRTMR